jgi:hypothetical protein
MPNNSLERTREGICLPGYLYESSPEVAVTEVEKGLFSSRVSLRVGETNVHQPVFRDDVQIKTARAAIIEVVDKGVTDGYYVITFPPQLELREDEWTAWQLRTFKTKNDPTMHLLHNQEYIYGEVIEKVALEGSAPRVRFLLEDWSDFNWIRERRLNGEVHNIAVCQ